MQQSGIDFSERDQEHSIVHVAVAVIVKNNSVLIARRPSHVHQGDLWEFPGGKVEAGETVKQALCREMQEELGIEITHSEPLISVLYHYEDKSVLLDTWKVSRFKGRTYNSASISTGLENQKVQWVAVDNLKDYSFPAANKPIVSALVLPDTYLITPDTDNTEQFLAELEKTINSDRLLQQKLQEKLPEKSQLLVQLRIGSLPGEALEPLIVEACELADDLDARITLNAGMLSRSELNAVACTRLLALADGLHLPAHFLSEHGLSENRLSEQGLSEHRLFEGLLPEKTMIQGYREVFPDKLLSASCHNLHEIELANRHRVDFILLSPVQITGSHPDAAVLGWEKFAQLAKYSQSPVYALGGLGLKDLVRAKISGAQGIAAISSLWVNQ